MFSLFILATLSFVPGWSQPSNSPNQSNPAGNPGQTITVEPRELRFEAIQPGSSAILNIKIHNRSSKPVVVARIFSDNLSFTSLVSGNFSIPPWSDRVVGVKFQPVEKGKMKGTLEINLDVKGRAKFKIKLSGDGIGQPPLTVLPASIDTVAPKGSVVQQIFTLTNDGSSDRDFRIEAGRDESTLLFPSMPDSTVYKTGFEEFNAGTIDGQNGWASMSGWEISNANADEGVQHLRGTALTTGSEFNLIAPAAFHPSWRTDTKHYSTFTSRLNLDNAAGAAWEIVLRDTYGVLVGNILINPDRTIDVSSKGGNYTWVETRLDAAAIPSHGYFTIVFELIWGQNNINPWNSVNLYIDESLVFKGYSMGGTIGNVSITCNPVTTGATLDIDNLRIGLGKYSCDYITATPAVGVIPAGESVDVTVSIDPASLEFRNYNQGIIVHVDEADSLHIPVTFEVIGKAWMAIQAPTEVSLHRDYGDEELYLLNMGGTEIQFEVQSSRSYVNITPSTGTILKEGVAIVRVGIGWSVPGSYSDTVKIVTNIEGFPTYYLPVMILVSPPEEYEGFSADSAQATYANDSAVRVAQNDSTNKEVGQVDQESIVGSMSLYPNPGETNGSITLQIPGMDVPPEVVHILIISTTGKVAYAAQEVLKDRQAAFTITEAFRPGMYLVILSHGQRKYSKRFLVK